MDIMWGPYLNVGWGSEKEAMYEQTALDCNEMRIESARLTNTSKLTALCNLYI